MESCLAIITARGGSKRIPGKNIRPFLGKPIIAYSVEAALGAGCFTEVMVSTDDPLIADIAASYGASIPFLRSDETSGDYTTSAEVVLEVIREYEKLGRKFDYVCCIYPTAPFISAKKLNTAYFKLNEADADVVIPVVSFGFPILRSFKIEDGLVKMNWPEYMNTRSQDLLPAYHDCGQFYFLNTKRFLENKKLYMDKMVPMEIPESEVQDIDNEEDWRVAEIKYTFFVEKQNNAASDV